MPVLSSDVVTIVKTRLGITDEVSDGLIDSYADELEQRILHYCNIEEVPVGLKFVWASMTVELFAARHPTAPAVVALFGKTIEISAGDTTTKTTINKGRIDAIVTSYASDLDHYRKLRW